jgi:hypothetical protein
MKDILDRHSEQRQRIEGSVSQFGAADLARELRRIQLEETAAAKTTTAEVKKGLWARLFGK